MKVHVLPFCLIFLFWGTQFTLYAQLSLYQDQLFADRFFPMEGFELISIGENVNVRAEANSDAPVVGKLSLGQSVFVLPFTEFSETEIPEKDQWLKIKFETADQTLKTGYVWGGLLARGAWQIELSDGKTGYLLLGELTTPNDPIKDEMTIRVIKSISDKSGTFQIIASLNFPKRYLLFSSRINEATSYSPWKLVVTDLNEDQKLLNLSEISCACNCFGSDYYIVLKGNEMAFLNAWENGNGQRNKSFSKPLLSQSGKLLAIRFENKTGFDEIELYNPDLPNGEAIHTIQDFRFEQVAGNKLTYRSKGMVEEATIFQFREGEWVEIKQ